MTQHGRPAQHLKYIYLPADKDLLPTERVVKVESTRISCDAAHYVPTLLRDGPLGFNLVNGVWNSVLPFPTFNESLKDHVPLFFFKRSEARDKQENVRAKQLLELFAERLSKRQNTFYGDVVIFWRRSIDETRHMMKLVDFTLAEFYRLVGGGPTSGGCVLPSSNNYSNSNSGSSGSNGSSCSTNTTAPGPHTAYAPSATSAPPTAPEPSATSSPTAHQSTARHPSTNPNSTGSGTLNGSAVPGTSTGGPHEARRDAGGQQESQPSQSQSTAVRQRSSNSSSGVGQQSQRSQQQQQFSSANSAGNVPNNSSTNTNSNINATMAASRRHSRDIIMPDVTSGAPFASGDTSGGLSSSSGMHTFKGTLLYKNSHLTNSNSSHSNISNVCTTASTSPSSGLSKGQLQDRSRGNSHHLVESSTATAVAFSNGADQANRYDGEATEKGLPFVQIGPGPSPLLLHEHPSSSAPATAAALANSPQTVDDAGKVLKNFFEGVGRQVPLVTTAVETLVLNASSHMVVALREQIASLSFRLANAESEAVKRLQEVKRCQEALSGRDVDLSNMAQANRDLTAEVESLTIENEHLRKLLHPQKGATVSDNDRVAANQGTYSAAGNRPGSGVTSSSVIRDPTSSGTLSATSSCSPASPSLESNVPSAMPTNNNDGAVRLTSNNTEKGPNLQKSAVSTGANNGNSLTRYLVTQTYSASPGAGNNPNDKFAILSVGDTVRVEREDASGWWWVSNGRPEGSGWYPYSFLQSTPLLSAS